MTDSLKQLDQLAKDLQYFKRLEDFYNENHIEPEKEPPIPGASGMVFFDREPTVDLLEWRVGLIREEIYNKLDKVIKKQQAVINKLKKK